MTTALACAECGAPMDLRQSKFGLFWGCSRWATTGCRGSHGAHPDGTPLGIPADQTTKLARIRAHDAFDRLWQSRRMSRKAAYRWMRETLDLTPEAAHIGRFTVMECDALCVAIARHFPAVLGNQHHDSTTGKPSEALK